MDVSQLLAREAIRDLVARYNAYGDSGPFDRMSADRHEGTGRRVVPR